MCFETTTYLCPHIGRKRISCNKVSGWKLVIALILPAQDTRPCNENRRRIFLAGDCELCLSGMFSESADDEFSVRSRLARDLGRDAYRDALYSTPVRGSRHRYHEPSRPPGDPDPDPDPAQARARAGARAARPPPIKLDPPAGQLLREARVEDVRNNSSITDLGLPFSPDPYRRQLWPPGEDKSELRAHLCSQQKERNRWRRYADYDSDPVAYPKDDKGYPVSPPRSPTQTEIHAGLETRCGNYIPVEVLEKQKEEKEKEKAQQGQKAKKEKHDSGFTSNETTNGGTSDDRTISPLSSAPIPPLEVSPKLLGRTSGNSNVDSDYPGYLRRAHGTPSSSPPSHDDESDAWPAPLNIRKRADGPEAPAHDASPTVQQLRRRGAVRRPTGPGLKAAGDSQRVDREERPRRVSPPRDFSSILPGPSTNPLREPHSGPPWPTSQEKMGRQETDGVRDGPQSPYDRIPTDRHKGSGSGKTSGGVKSRSAPHPRTAPPKKGGDKRKIFGGWFRKGPAGDEDEENSEVSFACVDSRVVEGEQSQRRAHTEKNGIKSQKKKKKSN